MRKNFKKAAFSVALAMGAVGQVAAPLANPIVAMAADLTTDQQAISDALTNGNQLVTVRPYLYVYDGWAGSYTEKDDFADAFTVNGNAVTLNSSYGSSSRLYFELAETTVAKKVSFTISGYSGSETAVTMAVDGTEMELGTISADGTYEYSITNEVDEICLSFGSAKYTISELSVTEDETAIDAQDVSDALSNTNITVRPFAYTDYDSWAGTYDELYNYNEAFNVNGNAVEKKDSNNRDTIYTKLYFDLAETTLTKKVSFTISNYSGSESTVSINVDGTETELGTISADGTYEYTVTNKAAEMNISFGDAKYTISDVSVEENVQSYEYQINDNVVAAIKGDTMTFTVSGDGVYKVYGDNGTNFGQIPDEYKNVIKNIEFEGMTDLDTSTNGMNYINFGDYFPNIESVTFPEGLESIGGYAFNSCSNLNSINIPSTLTEIGNGAFLGTALTEVIIPDNQELDIRQECFSSITTLKEVYLGNKVTFTWGDNFAGCTNVEKLTVNMEDFGKNYVAGTNGYSNSQFEDIGLNTIEGTEVILGDSVPESITTIIFQNLGKIKSITIPDHVTQIGDINADYPDVESTVIFNQDVAGEVTIDAPQLFLDNTTWLGSGITPVISTDDSGTTDSASISADSFTVKVGESIDLEATVSGDMSDYKWIIGNADTNETEAVASIDEYGTVTGLKAGYAIVGIVNANNELLDQKSVVVIPAEYDSYDSWISGGGPLLSVGGQTVTPGGGYGYGFSGYTGGGSNSISGIVSGSITGGSSAGGSTGGGSGSTGGSEGSGSEGSGSGSEGGSGSGSGSEGSGSTGSNQNDMCITGYITPITEMDVTIPLDGFKFHIDENRDLIPTISNLENNSQFPLDVNALNIDGSTGTEPSVIAADTYTQYEWDNMNKRNTLANMALYLNGEELYSVFQNDNLDTSKAINIGRLESGFSGTTSMEVTPGAQYGKNFGNKTETLTFVYDLVLEFEVPLA